MKDKKPYKILVVEDNPGDFTLVRYYLSEQISDPDISHTDNFKKASSLLSGGNSEFDIILLDLTLPDKSGQDLIAEMLKIASCPIIIFTGNADIDFSIKSISQGISDYLLKDDLNASILYKSIIYALERKKSISQLKESETRYSNLFHLSPQPMWVYDPETFRFIQVNKAAIEHYDYSEDEFLDMSVLDIRPKEDILRAKDVINKSLVEKGSVYNGKFNHCKKSGQVIEVEIYSAPMSVNNKNLRFVIAIDVTEKNLYEHKITKAIIKTQEDERYEIGAELHDNICQVLAASQISLGMLKPNLHESKLAWHDQCRENISTAINEIRNLSHRLAPAFFDDTTIEEAFERLLNSFNASGKYKIRLQFDSAIKDHLISLELQLNLYRILQEQLSNILKHASASLIEIEVLVDESHLRMSITDNGKGFNSNQKGGIGLSNMKRRAELFSGNFEINSSPGNGCKIKISIPLQVQISE